MLVTYGMILAQNQEWSAEWFSELLCGLTGRI